MGKYQPLRIFLEDRSEDRVPMTFAEIEAVLGDKLPASKVSRAWWSNNADNNVMTREWLAAGYRAEAVDLQRETLVFVRRAAAADDAGTEPFVEPRHPAFGCMRGTVVVARGVDLTEPVLADWAGYALDHYGPQGQRRQP